MLIDRVAILLRCCCHADAGAHSGNVHKAHLDFALQPDLPVLVHRDDDADVHIGDDDADNNDENGGRSLNRRLT